MIDYVREFTKDVPRTQVLTASSLISEPSSVVESIQEISWVPTNGEHSFVCLSLYTNHPGIFVGLPYGVEKC